MSGFDSIIHRREPSPWHRFLSSPAIYTSQLIYNAYTRGIAPANSKSPNSSHQVRIVCISDTHNTHASQLPLPSGDILVHAGDLTHSGTSAELESALAWLSAQSHPIKLFVAGNHDAALADPCERESLLEMYPGLIYLEDKETTVDVRGRELKVYGSPRTPKHGSWPFQYPRVPASAPHSDIWSSIPDVIDILITHGPPLAHLDCNSLGCVALLDALWRVRPRVHVFGHVHAGRGVELVGWSEAQRAYEGVCRREGLVYLVRLAWWAPFEIVGGWLSRGTRGETILVNAAAVGGFRDEKRLGAMTVDI